MRYVRIATASLVVLAGWMGFATPARAAPERVSVQPFDGTIGPTLRGQVTRMLRKRGFRVITSIPRVTGTGQYLTLARDHRLSAFVTGDVEERKTSHTITFLVWNGSNGSVLARWSARAAPKRMPKAVAKGFWKHLGPALEKATRPESPDDLPPAPPMYINATEP